MRLVLSPGKLRPHRPGCLSPAAPPAPRSACLCAVSEAQQSDPRLLAAVYDDMAAKFAQHGLNLPAVAAMQQYFDNLEGEGEAFFGWQLIALAGFYSCT